MDITTQSHKTSKASQWTEVNIADISNNPPQPPEFLFEPWLPENTLTLFSGHGGTGKSLLALLIASHLSLGLKIFEKNVKKCPVIFYSAEDSKEIIRHRISIICKHLDVNPTDIAENLKVLDATDLPCLYEITSNEKGTMTGQYQYLAEYIATLKIKPKLLIIDNASLTFDGNENSRKQTGGFLHTLIKTCKDHRIAILLLAHVDKPTAKGEQLGQGYSGSTAWHNSARSRWFLKYERDDLILFHQKSNYSKLDDPINLSSNSGLILFDPHYSSIMLDSLNIKILLTLIYRYYERGDYISPLINSRSNPFSTLREDSNLPKEIRTRKAMRQHIEFLENNGFLTRENFTNHYKDRIRYKITEKGHHLMSQEIINKSQEALSKDSGIASA